MKPPLGRRSFVIASLVLEFGTFGALWSSPSAAASLLPPDGTYAYVISQNGAKVGQSVVTIKTSPKGISVQEKAVLGPVSGTTRFLLQPGSLNEESYSADLKSPQGDQHVDVSPQNGAMNITAGSQSIDVKALPDAPTLMISDNFVATTMLVPAMARAANAHVWTVVALVGGKPLKGEFSGKDSAGSTSVSINGLSFIYRIDASTGVLKDIAVPAQNVTIALQPTTP